MRVKAVTLAVDSMMPPDMRGQVGTLDAKGLGRLFHKLALNHPDKYREILHRVTNLGRNAAYWEGETLTLDDFEDTIDTRAILKEMDAEVAAETKGIQDPEAARQKRELIWGKYAARMEREAMQAGMKKGNSVAYMVASGARGKPLQLRAMLSTPALFEDWRGRQVPLFARSSYAQGVSPGTFLAGTYGARTSVTSTKVGTAKGGYLGKLLAQVADPVLVTEEDCGTTNGIDLPKDDDDLKHRVLARSVGGVSAGSVLDRKALAGVLNAKGDKVLVRSAITCEARNGVCAKCAGADPKGQLFKIGTAVGTTAANALSEPATQLALNSKHTSGAATQKKTYSGLDWLTRFVQVPDDFPDRAPLAERDGVAKVEAAPQGGWYVNVDGKSHYVPAHLELKVKDGQPVEKGDVLSDGVVRPNDVVRLEGLGQGRRYWAERLHQMLADSGIPGSRRNTEIVARGAVNHVRVRELLDDADNELLPDDVVPFNLLMQKLPKPENVQVTPVAAAGGKYLQRPALHFLPGTQLTPRVIRRLKENDINEVEVSDKAPVFEAEMPRLATATFAQPDWFAAMGTSYLKQQLTTRATRGQDTNFKSNIHYAPRLAFGEGFGDKLEDKAVY